MSKEIHCYLSMHSFCLTIPADYRCFIFYKFLPAFVYIFTLRKFSREADKRCIMIRFAYHQLVVEGAQVIIFDIFTKNFKPFAASCFNHCRKQQAVNQNKVTAISLTNKQRQ